MINHKLQCLALNIHILTFPLAVEYVYTLKKSQISNYLIVILNGFSFAFCSYQICSYFL